VLNETYAFYEAFYGETGIVRRNVSDGGMIVPLPIVEVDPIQVDPIEDSSAENETVGGV